MATDADGWFVCDRCGVAYPPETERYQVAADEICPTCYWEEIADEDADV